VGYKGGKSYREGKSCSDHIVSGLRVSSLLLSHAAEPLGISGLHGKGAGVRASGPATVAVEAIARQL
jgi:hypothetical protein